MATARSPHSLISFPGVSAGPPGVCWEVMRALVSGVLSVRVWVFPFCPLDFSHVHAYLDWRGGGGGVRYGGVMRRDVGVLPGDWGWGCG